MLGVSRTRWIWRCQQSSLKPALLKALVGKVAAMGMPVAITSLQLTCSAEPSSWQGQLDDGRCVYIRYRWGWLRVTAASTYEDAITFATAETVAILNTLYEGPDAENLSEEDFNGRAHERAQALRENIFGGELLYHERVGGAGDGEIDVVSMLEHLESAGIGVVASAVDNN